MKPFRVFLILCICFSCESKRRYYPSPDNYDLSSPEKMVMKESLLEISGITFLDKDTLLAINDEEGIIFSVPLMGKRNRLSKFASSGDYEDVTKYKNWIFILRSDGSIYVLADTRSESINAKKMEKVLPDGEYESLYADESTNKLYSLCKRCKDKKSKHRILQGYKFDMINDSIANREAFTIDIDSLVSPKNDQEEIAFAPSSMAKNKITNGWYILSSKNKALLIVDENWKAKHLFLLDPKIFNQPEGIAFDDENNLYISNEGDELQYGNILKFAYNEADKK